MKEVCAITGGTSGLGKGFVERFAADGYEVVFCGRREEIGAEIATANKATFIKADVAVASEMESFFAQIKSKFGRLDVLIVNSGTWGNVGRQPDIPIDEYKRVLGSMKEINNKKRTLKRCQSERCLVHAQVRRQAD